MTSPSDESAVSELQELITESGTVREFLDELTLFAARTISPAIGHPVECSVALRRRRRTITIAGSSKEALTLDQIEQALGGGPCMLALETNTTVLLNDITRDPRWPDFQRELTTRGYHAVLGIPLKLGKDSSAALDLFAPAPGAFTPAAIAIAEDFARIAGNALRLAVRIGTEQLLAEDLKAAMTSRTPPHFQASRTGYPTCHPARDMPSPRPALPGPTPRTKCHNASLSMTTCLRSWPVSFLGLGWKASNRRSGTGKRPEDAPAPLLSVSGRQCSQG
jgi:hypothetical protein